MTHPYRPRRSCLYMPGANARALDKARNLPADVVIMDLEDAVEPDAKGMARNQVAEAVQAGGYAPREVWVRMNALGTPWGEDDLAMIEVVHPDAVLVPKVNHPDDIHAVNERLRAANLHGEIAIWAMIETPMAILNLQGIASTAERTRLRGFVVGTNDLAKDMQLPLSLDRTGLQSALSQTVTAARAYGIEVLDGVFNDLGNPENLTRQCQQGVALGFDGKTLIHPNQIDATNRVFSPSQEDVAEARAICAAFDAPENAGRGVLKVAGKMTERLHYEAATRTLALQEAIDARDNN